MDQVTVRVIDASERDYWDDNVQQCPLVHPLNAYDWGTVREGDGWSAIRLVAERAGRFCGALQLLTKKLPALPWYIFYGPKGFICAPGDRETVFALDRKVVELAKSYRAIFLRIDPHITEAEAKSFDAIVSSLAYRHLKQRWTFWNSPRDVFRIDLSGWRTTDDLLNSLDRDTRRCIRKAAKEGVVVEAALDEGDLRKFYDIFRTFSDAKGFMARGFGYQKRLWECYVARDRGRLFLAKYNGQVIGGLLCIVFGRRCLAMHMGTPYQYHRLHSYYAYVWESIRWAKSQDCVWYSFRGVGTTPSQEAFKSKFGPKVVPLVGYYDRPFRPLLYRLFYFGEFTVLPAAWPLLVRVRRILSWGKNAH